MNNRTFQAATILTPTGDPRTPFVAHEHGRFVYPTQRLRANGVLLHDDVEITSQPKELVYPLPRSAFDAQARKSKFFPRTTSRYISRNGILRGRDAGATLRHVRLCTQTSLHIPELTMLKSAYIALCVSIVTCACLRSQTQPPGVPPTAAQKDAICEGIAILRQFEQDLPAGDSHGSAQQKTQFRIKRAVQSRIETAEQMKKPEEEGGGILITPGLAGDRVGGGKGSSWGWTGAEGNVARVFTGYIPYTYSSTRVCYGNERTHIDKDRADGTGISAALKVVRLGLIMGHEAARQTQTSCEFNNVTQAIMTKPEGDNFEYAGWTTDELRGLKKRYTINRDTYEVDVAYLNWCLAHASNLGLSATDVQVLTNDQKSYLSEYRETRGRLLAVCHKLGM